MAVRTPLYMVWAHALSDRQTRLQMRGKKWDKAVWMLQASYHYHQNHHDRSSSEDRCCRNVLLHASITMDVYLPDQVVSLMIAAYPEQLRIPDALGHVPLTVAVLGYHSYYSLARLEAVVEYVLQAYPAAARHRHPETGRSALLEAIVAGHQWTASTAAAAGNGGVLERLLQAHPGAMDWRDGENGLPPALLAAVPRKQVLQRTTASNCGDSFGIDSIDPCNLLTTKQHELIQQQNKHVAAAVDGSNSSLLAITEVPGETTQLETIYKLLQTNPAQFILTSA
jgi:hypothetical protein